jgi:hypothetical protein
MMMVQLSSPHTTYSTQRKPDANPSSLTEDRQPGFHLPSPDSTPPKQIGIGRGNIDRHLSMTPQPPCTHANIHMTAPPCPGQSRGHRERRNPCQLDVNAASHETRASRVQPRTPMVLTPTSILRHDVHHSHILRDYKTLDGSRKRMEAWTRGLERQCYGCRLNN